MSESVPPPLLRPRSLVWIVSGIVAICVIAAGITLAVVLGGPGHATHSTTASHDVPGHGVNVQPQSQPTPKATTNTQSPIDPSGGGIPAASVSVTSASATANTAIALLATLPIKPAQSLSGYIRTTDFGRAWLDVDRNGCDTRDDILARDLVDIERPGSCYVTSGTLVSPYTGATQSFLRGENTSALVQIDHVVALADAWETGAQSLTQAQRVTLANDPLELLAVDGQSNQVKGDDDAASWLPSNASFDCSYVARQISVKVTYALWVTRAEHDAMAKVLASCPTVMGMASQFAPAAG